MIAVLGAYVSLFADVEKRRDLWTLFGQKLPPEVVMRYVTAD